MPIQLALLPSFVTNFGGAFAPPNFIKACNNGNVQSVLLNGKNPSAGTSITDIWGYPSTSGGGAQLVRTLPTSAYTIAVISDSVADVYGTGTGAWVAAVQYLDTNYNSHVALYQLNGQTAVTTYFSLDGNASSGTVTNALRQNGLEIVAAGTGASAAGNIYICDSTNTYTAGVPQTTTKVFDCLLAGDNVDSSSQFTVPAGYYAMILQLIPAINDVTATAKYGKIRLYTTTGANGLYLSFDMGGVSSNNNPVAITPILPPLIQPKSDVRIASLMSAATEVGCVNIGIIWPVS